jgi:ribonuclease III
MDSALDVVLCRTLAPHRGRLLTSLAVWLERALGAAPRDLALYGRALTHGSAGGDSYQRLEFLGDRVLGLTIARWLYAAYPQEPEGQLSRRLNTLVTGQVCAEIARDIGASSHMKLGKQARDDGAYDSDNILGDVTEALIGALYLDHGFEAAEAFIRKHWSARVEGHVTAPSHPKSALQEWAAAHNRRPPVYAITGRTGPHHNPKFAVTVTLGSAGQATGEGTSKQEAETAAAMAMLEKLT